MFVCSQDFFNKLIKFAGFGKMPQGIRCLKKRVF